MRPWRTAAGNRGGARREARRWSCATPDRARPRPGRRGRPRLLVVPVAGCGGDEQRRGVGIADDDGVAGGATRTARGDDADASLEAQRACHRTTVRGRAGTITIGAAHHEVAVCRLHGCLLRRLHARLERDTARTARRQTHDDDLIGCAREHFARECHPAAGVGHAGRGRRQVELAAVVLDRLELREVSARSPTVWYGICASGFAITLLPTSVAASRYLPSASSRRTSGRAAFASGLTGS